MDNHESYMHRAIELAKLGMGSVAPNPMVGCVIIKNDTIISEGYHREFGSAHAEVNAINNLPSDFNFEECTLYVSLEPCSHFGKTPPCSNLIIQKKNQKGGCCKFRLQPSCFRQGHSSITGKQH